MSNGIIKTAGEFVKSIADGVHLDVRYYKNNVNEWGNWEIYKPKLDSYLQDLLNEFKDGAEYRIAQIKRYNVQETMQMLLDGKKMQCVDWGASVEYVHFVNGNLVFNNGKHANFEFYRGIIFVEVE